MPEETHEPPQTWPNFFVSELVHQRTARGWGQRRLGLEANVSASTIANIESGLRFPTIPVARAIDKAFGTHGMFERLAIMVLRNAAKGWVRELLATERISLNMKVFESQVIPGLLQTEEYARAMLTDARTDDVELAVALRMARKEVFSDKDKHPYCRWIIDEQVLRRPIGGPEVMRPQLEHLLRMAEHPRRNVQILGAEVASHPGLSGAFTIFEVPEEDDERVEGSDKLVFETDPRHARTRKLLWIDGFIEGRTTPDAENVAQAERAYDLLTSVALSPQASVQRIREILKTY